MTYEAKRAARIDRLRERAEKKHQESAQVRARARSLQNFIPLGQPILVGHHSEGRHRRALAKIGRDYQRAMALRDEASELARRANAAERNRAISSDDPEALAKLRAKLADERASLDAMKRVNAAIRRRKNADRSDEDLAAELGVTAEAIGVARRPLIGRPGFLLANTRAEIVRLQKRIAELETAAETEPMEPQTFGEIEVSEGDNRIRIWFPRKPSPETCTLMRRSGFVFSRRWETWQRMAKPYAREIALRLAAELAKKAEQGTPW